MALDRLTKITGPGIKTDTNWVGNNANFTGITTTGSSFNVGVSTFHSTLAEVHNIKSTGIITATGGSFSGNVTAVDGTFSGNVSIAGTLTYEDVTNIDAVGIITAPALDVDDFLDVGSNIKLGNAGVITATSFVGSGAALTGIDATAIKDSGGNVKIQAQASGAVHTGVSTLGTSGSGQVFLQYQGTTRLQTNSSGVLINGAANIFNNGSNICVGGLGINASIFHNGDENTGMDFTDSDRVRFRTGGGERLAVTNTGIHFNVTGISTFEGNIDANGDLVVDGNVDLGSNTSDTLTISALVDSDIVPSGTTRDLGGSSNNWRNGYFSGTVSGAQVNLQSAGGELINVTSTNAASRSTIKFNTNGNDYEIGARGSSADNPNNFYIYDNNANNYRMLINSNGAVSILGDLDVDGHTNLDNVSIAGVSTISNHFFLQKDAAYIDFKQTDGTQTGYIQSRTTDFRFNSYGARPVKFGTNDIERVRIDSDGKVGINTDDARFNNASNIASASFYHNDPKFGVHGSMVIGNLSATATDERQLAFYRRGGPAPGTPMSTHKMGRIAWYGSSNDTSLPDLAGSIECVPNGGGWTAGSNRRGSITFNNHEKETVRINSAGYVGIGTENPQRPLAVTNGTSGVTAEFNVPDNAPTGSAGLSLNIVNRSNSGYAPLSFNSTVTTFGNSGVEKARLDNNGNWCVGITGGSAKLHTKGDQGGGLIKNDAAEGTTRFFVTGNNSNNCEVNLYDASGNQRGIIKAENDGMSMKGGGTPSQLQFFTTVTGGSSTRRLLIDDYGATQIERGSNGWSTMYHKTNNGGTRYHYRQANAGSSGTTVNLMRIRRHYWGSGNYKISTRQTYYNGSFESHHYISGHAANGNTSAFSINYQNQNGGNSSQIQKTATSHSSPGNHYAGWIDVYISIGAYEYYDIIIEASGMPQYSQDINNLGNDAYALHPV